MIRPTLRSVWPVDKVLEEELMISTLPTIPSMIPTANTIRNKCLLRTNAHIPSGLPKKRKLNDQVVDDDVETGLLTGQEQARMKE